MSKVNRLSPIIVGPDRIFISGELTFATVEAVWEASQKLFPEKGPWNCDFSEVKTCDSASLALLIEWIKAAQKKKIKLSFFNLPEQLQSIASAAKLTTVLGDFTP